jgi:uncharacterized delta-60 repeat protein
MRNTLTALAVTLGLVSTLSIFAAAQACGTAGCLDDTFGTGGKVTIPFPPSPGAGPLDICIMPDGKILELVYGNRFVRLNADGTLDQTFGSGGVATFAWPVTGAVSYGHSMRLQDIGGQQRIVVAGPANTVSGHKTVEVLRMARFMPDAAIDTSFGTSGTVTINGAGYAEEIEIQTDGKIVMLSSGNLVRTNANGALDTGFGSGGIVSTGYDNGDIAIDGNGGILVGDDLTTGSGRNTKMMMVVKRYTSIGLLDTGFGIAGIATADFNAKSVTFGKLAIDPFGNVVVAGGVVAPGNGQWYFAAARFMSNGVADTTFGGTGKVQFLGAAGMGDHGALTQADGKVVITGNLNGDYGIVRYNYNGTLDTAFGNGGSVIDDVDLQDDVKTSTIQIDPGCACSKLVMSSYGIGGPNLSFARFRVD